MVIESNIAAEQLLNQFEASCKMVGDAIENVPEQLWTKSIGSWFYASTIYHLIETMDFYCRDDYESMVFGERAGYNWDDVKDVENDILPLISKNLVSDYLTEMEEKLSSFLSNVSTDELFGKDGFYWFESVYHKMLYLLRHTQHHIGELAVTLRSVKAGPIKWT